MGKKKVVTMVLKVDLQCEKCYRKVKKVLCKYPQIQDQVYDEKQNTVTIKVVCCSPEKIKQKISCKGGESIKGIEIVPPPKPKPKEEKPKKEVPTETPRPPPDPPGPKDPGQSKKSEKPKEKPAPSAATAPAPCFPQNPVRVCCRECYEGQGGGPCYQLGYRGPPICYDGYYGRPVYDSWGGGRGGCYC
ncbi:protein PYRICULARIA ORYZAE RESISTANCE 21-like isoform X3 [Mangifera indica]|uniref:protein PYRICULARIA ORYZAE RESISTANCE 21-like isoform X1 n=1 Tax=Mangifera indica TaxID=29780 RepID=UPI001CFBEA54|nr:protein PYRICULARIA ORYZAE RESISTANCE 21-like isoform X1 [Mangifera indica]XP_044481040.1 protein PYRICULARIA ORYZAE RESISTANCE 21-like isoform X3 [Mangifera indica]